MTPDRPLAGLLLMAVAVLLFSLQDGVTKVLAESQHWGLVAWGRYFWQTVFLLPLFWQAGRGAWRTATPAQHVLRALALMSSGVFFILALAAMPIADATVIAFVSPLLITVLAVPFLGERVGPRRWIAVVIGFLAVILVARPGGEGFGWAAIWPLLSGVVWAVALVLTRRMRIGDTPATTLLYTTATSLLVASLGLPWAWSPATPQWWLLAALMGGLCAAGQWLLIRAFALASASLLAPLNYLQIVWSSLIGLLVFGTWPDAWTWTGAAVIVASGLYIAHREALAGRQAA